MEAVFDALFDHEWLTAKKTDANCGAQFITLTVTSQTRRQSKAFQDKTASTDHLGARR